MLLKGFIFNRRFGTSEALRKVKDWQEQSQTSYYHTLHGFPGGQQDEEGPHPSYSLKLAPSDFVLFADLKRQLREYLFDQFDG
jgi:hypothetical protein